MTQVSQRSRGPGGDASNSVPWASPHPDGQSQAPPRGPYTPEHRDEALTPAGDPRPEYRDLIEALEDTDLAGLEAGVQRRLAGRGVTFGGRSGQTFHVDPVPRVIDAREWETLEAGVAQRSRALNAFLADLHGERRVVSAGVIPERVIGLADHHQPALDGVEVPGGHAPVVGFDLVRGADGTLRVLEDNCRTPSGTAYLLAAREALDEAYAAEPTLGDELVAERRASDSTIEMLAAAIDAARPADGPELGIVLSDSIGAGARYEHEMLGAALGMPVVTPSSLRRRGEVIVAELADGEREVGVVYRRSDDELITAARGGPNWVADLFLEPLRAGRVTVMNAFGSGVADDKLTHAYVEEMVRFYLAEEPALESVRTIDLTADAERAEALDRLDELVVKPRSGQGGYGIMIGPHASPADRDAARVAIAAHPEVYVAQETVELSTHPTVHNGLLEPRHVDLRAFAIGDRVVPGGLTRFARERGALVVNSSQNGGAKDTWVVDLATDGAGGG